MKKLFICLISIMMILALSGCTLFAPPSDDDTLSIENVYSMAQEAGYSGTLEDFVNEFKGEAGLDGKDGVGIKAAEINAAGHLMLTLTDNTQVDAGEILSRVSSETIAPAIGDNGNWFVNGVDTGVKASGVGAAWYTGASNPDANLGADGDFYLSTTSLGVYAKKDGAWVYVGTMEDKAPSSSGAEMTVAAMNRALLSSVIIRCAGSQAGSGVIYQLDKSRGNAYIITNYHVVYNEKSGSIFSDSAIKVRLYGMDNSGYEIDAEYVGGSVKYDIAVLKISGSAILKNSNAMPAIFADSEKALALDSVVAIGNPKNGGLAATKGIISKESEYITTIVGGYANTNTRVMRIDAAINGGNSGGGLFNTSGEVVGIVNAKSVDPYGVSEENIENMAYAIPSNIAKSIADNILYYCAKTSQTNGKYIDTGIDFDINSMGTEFDSETGRVLTYEEVKITDAPSGLGLQVNDILRIITVDGIEYEIKHEYQPEEIILNIRPGSTVVLGVVRSGVAGTVSLNIPSEIYFSNID